MNKKLIVIAAIMLVIGFLGGVIYSDAAYSSNSPNPVLEGSKSSTSGVQNLQGASSRDKASPSSWIKNEQIYVFDNEVILDIKNAKWAVFTDTKSMDPVIDSTSKAIQVIPANESQIRIGDIVAYESKYENGLVTHRIVAIEHDSKGWYAIMKGDNNSYPDPEKVRFEQVKRVVVAIIY